MKITDIIRGILDQVDRNVEQHMQQHTAQPEPEVVVAVPTEQPAEEGSDLLSIIQQLAGLSAMPTEPDYANAPNEIISPIKAAFPAGDDVHASKHPADIRSDSFSMYPNYQAPKR